MSITSMTLVKDHLRVLGDDDDATIQAYTDAAEDAVMQYLNRAIYPDTDTQVTGVAAGQAAMATADQDWATALAVARALPCGPGQIRAIDLANANYSAAVQSALEKIYGIVVNASITAAVLLTVGHLFANREDVITGVRAAAVQIPRGAIALQDPYRRGLGV